jgi:hypothetical protein
VIDSDREIVWNRVETSLTKRSQRRNSGHIGAKTSVKSSLPD